MAVLLSKTGAQCFHCPRAKVNKPATLEGQPKELRWLRVKRSKDEDNMQTHVRLWLDTKFSILFV